MTRCCNSSTGIGNVAVGNAAGALATGDNDFQATVAQQQKEIEALIAAVEEQAAQIQKVSD
ncbi:MAG: hypothetical protein WBX14_06590 [Candidatus Udaeobacter sp.]